MTFDSAVVEGLAADAIRQVKGPSNECNAGRCAHSVDLLQSENLDPAMFEQLQSVDSEAMRSQLEVSGIMYMALQCTSRYVIPMVDADACSHVPCLSHLRM